VWGTFGNADTWRVVQGIARLAECPWVGDIKDGWEQFIPRPLRGTMARRFNNAAGYTANSRFFGAQIEKWFGQRAEVLYSGVANEFFQTIEEVGAPGHLRITLSGSLYDDRALHEFLQVTANVLGRFNDVQGRKVEVVYAGGDAERFAQAAESVKGLGHPTIYGYLPLQDFARICQNATVNAYIRCPSTFHHKLLELLACGRPVISFPGELQEAIDLAAKVGGVLSVARSFNELTETLAQILCHAPESNRGPKQLSARFSWDEQARVLEWYLEKKRLGHLETA
jgi:glycosyltransferase involved in cell wall biosynthesis